MNTPRGERKIVPRVAPAASLVDSNQTTHSIGAKTGGKTGAAKGKLKFYLDLSDHIEAAPSIGPKAAERFEKIGVYTVTDFLKQTADSMADKINYKRFTADLIRQWQHQARLICRIPNLRGHDAQLLVACGITEPEELATMQPPNLLDIIGPFSETKEGLKIIRNGKKPDLAEITDWISWAEETRSLQAA
jgi:predicted flap endonuclease-1-like 5' DNA nuclease